MATRKRCSRVHWSSIEEYEPLFRSDFSTNIIPRLAPVNKDMSKSKGKKKTDADQTPITKRNRKQKLTDKGKEEAKDTTKDLDKRLKDSGKPAENQTRMKTSVIQSNREGFLRKRPRKQVLKSEPKYKRIRFTPKTQTCRNDNKTYKIRNLHTKCKMRPSQINFLNKRFRAKYPGRNRTIFSTFGALKYGKLKIQDLPKIRVFRYRNECFSPDTRRLYLYKMYARWCKLAHGADLLITVIFIEKFHVLGVARKLGVPRHKICHDRLPKYDDLKDEPKKFKLFLRPKKGQSKHLDPRGCRLSKGELKRLRQGQVPSMKLDLRHTPEEPPEYIPRVKRPPILLGDYIEKCIGDQLREHLKDKTYCFAGPTIQKTLKRKVKKAKRNERVSPKIGDAAGPKKGNRTQRKKLEQSATRKPNSNVGAKTKIKPTKSHSSSNKLEQQNQAFELGTKPSKRKETKLNSKGCRSDEAAPEDAKSKKMIKQPAPGRAIFGNLLFFENKSQGLKSNQKQDSSSYTRGMSQKKKSSANEHRQQNNKRMGEKKRTREREKPLHVSSVNNYCPVEEETGEDTEEKPSGQCNSSLASNIEQKYTRDSFLKHCEKQSFIKSKKQRKRSDNTKHINDKKHKGRNTNSREGNGTSNKTEKAKRQLSQLQPFLYEGIFAGLNANRWKVKSRASAHTHTRKSSTHDEFQPLVEFIDENGNIDTSEKKTFFCESPTARSRKKKAKRETDDFHSSDAPTACSRKNKAKEYKAERETDYFHSLDAERCPKIGHLMGPSWAVFPGTLFHDGHFIRPRHTVEFTRVSSNEPTVKRKKKKKSVEAAKYENAFNQSNQK